MARPSSAGVPARGKPWDANSDFGSCLKGSFPAQGGLALKLADRRGKLLADPSGRRESNHVPPTSTLVQLLGKDAPGDPETVARLCAISEARSRLIRNVAFNGGYESIRALMEVRGLEHVKRLREEGRGVLIATWHAGPTPSVWAALLGLGLPLWRISTREGRIDEPGWRVLVLSEDRFAGAALLKTCLRHLLGGGWIGAAFDVASPHAHAVPVPIFGRAVTLSTGLPALAAVSGCSVIPAISHWEFRPNRIVVEFLKPIKSKAGSAGADAVILQGLAGCMKSYYGAYPWELTAPKAAGFMGSAEIKGGASGGGG